MNFSAAILAGGNNTRFEGKPKSMALIKGKSIIERQLDEIGSLFDEIMIITDTPENYHAYPSLVKHYDIYPKLGPLSGIHSALVNASNNAVFIIAGDMPFIDSILIEKLIDEFFNSDSDALIPISDNGIEPLFGIYSKSCISMIEKMLISKKMHSVSSVLAKLRVVYKPIGFQPSFININTKAQIKEYEANWNTQISGFPS